MPTEPICPKPADVILQLRVLDGIGQWSIGILEADGRFEIRSGVVPRQESFEATRTEAVLAAFPAILESAAAHQYIVLDVSHALVRTAIAGMVDCVPNLLISETTAVGAYRTAVVAALDELPATSGARHCPKAQSLVISTDASIAHSGQVAGLGWVISAVDGTVLSCGQKTSATRRCGDILTGELLAIRYGVQSAIREHRVPVAGEGTVVVQSDSRPALRLLKTIRAGRYPAACTTDQIRIARKIIEECGATPIDFRWVKGHHGNELNEAADRLAMLARRNREFGVGAEVGQKMADDVRAELLAASA